MVFPSKLVHCGDGQLTTGVDGGVLRWDIVAAAAVGGKRCRGEGWSIRSWGGDCTNCIGSGWLAVAVEATKLVRRKPWGGCFLAQRFQSCPAVS
jgi:hypothetical protein